jgi:hypothetical protein
MSVPLMSPNVPSLRILSTLHMEATRSSETLIPRRPAWCHNPEGGILLDA